MRGDGLIKPAVEDHVADGGAHRGQVEAEEGEVVQPEQRLLVRQQHYGCHPDFTVSQFQEKAATNN